MANTTPTPRAANRRVFPPPKGSPAPNQGRRFPVEIPGEVRGLIERCSNRYPTGIRNRALLTVLYRGGLRLSEALALFPKDLDLTAR